MRAFIEFRPLSFNPRQIVTHFAVIASEHEIEDFKTLAEAVAFAKERGYSPVLVAKERHLQNRDALEYWMGV